MNGMLSDNSKTASSTHAKHCFVVMPFGRNSEERKWFSGWYEIVIKPAVEECGFECVLAAAEDQPGAINDEIRAHLALDPMVVVDLAGREPEDQPNPNVMYELGIRHAFGLPVVVMAWEGQALPFDVGNQRAIMSQRGFKDIAPTKDKLIKFIRSAQEGFYYKPMDAVGREAALETATISLGEDSALGALIEEVRYLKASILTSTSHRPFARPRSLTVKRAVGKLRSDLWASAQQDGFDPASWGKFLSMKLDEELFEQASTWTLADWQAFLGKHRPKTFVVLKSSGPEPSPEFLDLVDEMLGQQPWPTGEARNIAEKLDVSVSQVSKAIKILMSTGRRKYQHNGKIFETEEEYTAAVASDSSVSAN